MYPPFIPAQLVSTSSWPMTLKEVLISEGYSNQQLEEAMTMGTVKTAFQRGLEDIDQQGFWGVFTPDLPGGHLGF